MPPAPAKSALPVKAPPVKAPPVAFQVGARVMAQYSGDGQSYEAVVEEARGGQYLVNYGPVFNNDKEWLPASKLRRM
jgi:hypothetical protein